MFMLVPMLASADAVEINGIYYNLVAKAQQAEVTSNPNKYTGSVVIPEKVTYEGVEYSVTSIGIKAFEWCSSLTSISIPNSVTIIEDYAFGLCSRLTSITIPNSVTSIGRSAFYGCSSLTSITIPNSVTFIGYGAFLSCKGLTSITIPNSLTSLGSSAFYDCSGLTSVSIPNSVTTIDTEAFCGCKSLTSIIIPNSVTKIMYKAFMNCSSLTSVTIPNSVTEIQGKVFESCTGLTSVTIGSEVKGIFASAFAKCPELKDVYCLAENVPSTQSNAFQDSYIEYTTLHVPDASVSAYSNAEPWKNFGSIVGINGGGEAQKCATPTISYGGKKLTFGCATEGVEYVSEIKDADVKTHYGAGIDLSATYEISVYATKSGYTNSDVATATLVWTSASFTETTSAPGMVNAAAYDIPVLIQSNGGTLTVQGAVDDGTPVSVYSVNGTQAGTTVIQDGQAQVATSLQPGSMAIVKIGQKSVKVVVK